MSHGVAACESAELSPGARNRAGGPRDPILRRNREPRYWQHFSQERGTIGAVACARYLPLLLFCSKTFSQIEYPHTGRGGGEGKHNAITQPKLIDYQLGVSREKGSASKID